MRTAAVSESLRVFRITLDCSVDRKLLLAELGRRGLLKYGTEKRCVGPERPVFAYVGRRLPDQATRRRNVSAERRQNGRRLPRLLGRRQRVEGRLTGRP